MATSPQADYKQEVRFAVVMYGGVSLAIYINGVAQELLRLVRSTAVTDDDRPLTGSEKVYREVSYLLADEANGDNLAAEARRDDVPPTRFTVDIISGTSAGGINGIFLAKALANGQDMEKLKELWVQEGDIERLINDRKSVEKPLRLQNPPTSLLNSERMYFELLKAFDGMDSLEKSHKEDAESPLVDELDLFVTSTDLHGVVLPIRLSDNLIYEKRHRNVMHFVYSEPQVSGEPTRNDFHKKFNPFLAYAARCTSSFPFAFEPMALTDIDQLLRKLPSYEGTESSNRDWDRFYRDYRDPRGVSTVPFPKRPFGDGGYLDNKPFTHATETLMNRTASVPVDRKLIYIEPSPEHPEDDPESESKPDAIQNVMSALLTLPRYETIREDLQRINERNRLIDRVNAVTSGVDRDEDVVRNMNKEKFYADDVQRWKDLGALITPYLSDQLWAADALSDAQQGKLDLADVIKRKGRSYAAYHRLRVSAVTDALAKLITRVAGFDEHSEYSIIIRSMVRAWRIKRYIEYRSGPDDTRATANQFLFEFDLAYPMRRVNYLRSKVDALYRFDRDAMIVINIEARKFDVNFEDPNFDTKLKAAFCEQVLAYKTELNGLFVALRLAARALRSRQSTGDGGGNTLSDQVSRLMKAISDATNRLVPGKSSKSIVIDYFLGKRDPKLPGLNERSYRAASAQDQCVRRAEEFLDTHSAIMKQFEELADTLRSSIAEVKSANEKAIVSLFRATSTEPLDKNREIDTIKWIARYCVGHYYDHYEDYDLITYPILYDTDVGEADSIDVIRVSPEDANLLIDERAQGCHKLAGTALGHFGAFLQKSWRQNDILWGRLDGAERIISALLPNHPRREELIGQAEAAIVCETIEGMGEDERHELLAESLMRTKTRSAEPQLIGGLVRKLHKYSERDNDIHQKLKTLVVEENLRQYYLKTFRVRSKVNPETSLRSAARATNVVGKILESLSSDRNVNTKYALWIARLGQIFWALVEVAVPQSFPNLLFRHWLKVVYFLEVLLIAGGTLLAQPQMQQFGITAFAITAGIHLATVILGDLLKSQNRLLNLVKAIVIVSVIVLVGVGVLTVSALFGVQSAWAILQETRNWILTPVQIGLNSRTFFRFGVLLLVLLMFLSSIRKDITAIFWKGSKKQTRTSRR